jgi:D-xylose transport system substrate-binding protein
VRQFQTGPGDRRSLRFLLILAALALGLLAFTAAGCGGDDDDEAATDTGGGGEAAGGGACDKSIWVLLPDSATSPRWETDDRRYFEEAFT